MTIPYWQGLDPIWLGEDLEGKTCLRLTSDVDSVWEFCSRITSNPPRLFMCIYTSGRVRVRSYFFVGAWAELWRMVGALLVADDYIPQWTIFMFFQYIKLEINYFFRTTSHELEYENEVDMMSKNKDFLKNTRNLGTSSPADLPQSPDSENPQPVGKDCDADSNNTCQCVITCRCGERQQGSGMGSVRTVPSSDKNDEDKDVPSQSLESLPGAARTKSPSATDLSVTTKFVHVDSSVPASSTLASDVTLASSSMPASYESLKLLGIGRRKKTYPLVENDSKNPEARPRVSTDAQILRNGPARASFGLNFEEWDNESDEDLSSDIVVDEKLMRKIIMVDKSTDTLISSSNAGGKVNKSTESIFNSPASSTTPTSDTSTTSMAGRSSHLAAANVHQQEINILGGSSQAATAGHKRDPPINDSSADRNQTAIVSEAASTAAKKLGINPPDPGLDSWDTAEYLQSPKTSLKKNKPNDKIDPFAAVSAYQEDLSTRENKASVSSFVDRKTQSDTFLGNISSQRQLENKFSDIESRKSVKFADDFGMNLINVKDVPDTSSPPEIPERVLAIFSKFLDEEEKEDKPVSFTYLSPSFNQPGGESNFLNVVHAQNICLENVMVDDLSITGFVRVKCPSHQKRVVVRYTTNGWFSQEEAEATLLPTASLGGIDCFSFQVSAPQYLTPGSRLTLMFICYCEDHQFIDNNEGAYYDFECISKAHSSVGL